MSGPATGKGKVLEAKKRKEEEEICGETKRQRLVLSDIEGCSNTEDLVISGEDSKTFAENCDFVIKVGDVSFPAHQKILISSSEYFRGMLAHDTEERQNGFVEIKEIDSQTMKLCIDFMYGRSIDVTMETSKNLLPAAEFLQLTKLSEQCVALLEEYLYSGNCITVLKLARAYNCYELAVRAFDIFKEEFKMESFEDFCKLDKEGIKQHISDLAIEIAWDGIINWIKLDVENRSSDIVELVEMLNLKSFFSSDFLNSTWSEPLFKNCEFCRNLVFKSLFRKAELLKKMINIENCLIIYKIASEFMLISEEAEQVIYDFMEINLIQLADECEFKSLSRESVLRLFSNAEIGLCSETSLWNAALKWMKNSPEEKESFYELLKCIRFNQMTEKFIKSKVKTEPILSKIPELYKIFLDCIGAQQVNKTYVAILYPDGKMYGWNILDKTWRQLPDCPGKRDNIKMFSFRGKLCVLAEEELFYFGKNETEWIPRASLEQKPDMFACVAPSNNEIYNVGKERMSCYDPETNAWDESLPGCDLDENLFAACTSGCLIVRNTGSTYCYLEFERFCWAKSYGSNVTHISMTSNARHDRIYSIGHWQGSVFSPSHGKAEFFNNESRSWITIKKTPINIDKPSHLFFVDERLILLLGVKFYSYDSVFNTWMTLDDLPLPSYSQGLGNVNCQEPVAVCSFSGNLEKISPIDISK